MRKDIVLNILNHLFENDETLYYLPTVEIAAFIHETIEDGKHLQLKEQEIVQHLSLRDIQVLLSHHDRPGRI